MMGEMRSDVATGSGGSPRARGDEDSTRVVFVTRKYPPSVGGMQTLSAAIQQALTTLWPRSCLIALTGSNAQLWWWLPWALLRLLAASVRRSGTIILFGDALTWAVLSWIPRVSRIPCALVVHGLDITYSNPLYQAVAHPALRHAPLVIVVSSAARDTAIAAGVPPERVRAITPGIPQPPHPGLARAEARARLLQRLHLPADAALIATTGRLVRRKGVLWFTENVTPRLAGHIHHLVLGDGDYRERIAHAVAAHHLEGRTHLLGQVPDELRTEVLHGADLYIQPNIPVPGDIEGFGLVTAEASQAGLLTLAADLEGLADAVIDGETGILVPPGDADAWVANITAALENPERDTVAARYAQAARERYSVHAMAEQLRECLNTVRQ